MATNSLVLREATVRSVVPAGLEAVMLVGAEVCAAGGGMSLSWWHAEVASGRAPQPAFRSNRCTRWRLSEVVEYWRLRGEGAAANEAESSGPGGATAVVARAKRASSAAKAKREVTA